MTFVIAEPCVDVKDKACLDVCPVDCIYEGERTLYIQPYECIDCSACEPACPVEAIYRESELPAEWQVYEQVNAEFFTRTTALGSAGGAAVTGPAGVDHAYVAELPRQPAAD
ncbi:ferredoxin [Streptomyces sp. 12297]|uniref:ferredoxin n=1 Tax=Streptomyces sp. NBC_00239 TaxID=2903640 RepID=UPI002E2B04EC|nr:ferredoxin [Streptomyces sp. NBC_00239]